MFIDSSPPKRIVVEKAIKSDGGDMKKRMHFKRSEERRVGKECSS